MAIAHLQKVFKENLTDAVDKYKGYAKALGADTLVEYLLLTDNIAPACIKGTELVAEKLDENDERRLLVYNTEAFWKKIIRARMKKLHATRKWGKYDIGTWRDWQHKPKEGVYLGRKSARIKQRGGRDDLLLVIWNNSPTKANKIVEDGTKVLLKDLWTDFQDVINPILKSEKEYAKTLPKLTPTDPKGKVQLELDFGDLSGYTPSVPSGRIDYDDPMKQRPSKAFPGGRPTRTSTVFRQGAAQKEHARSSTKAKYALERELKNTSLWYSGLSYSVILDVVGHLRDNIEADWDQVLKKQQFAKFQAKNVLTLILGPNPDLATDVRPVMKEAKKFIQDEVLKADGGVLGDIKQEASKSFAKQIQEDVMKDIVKPFTDKRLAANRPRTASGAFDMRFKVNKGLLNLKAFEKKSRKEKLTNKKAKHTTMRTHRVVIKGKGPRREREGLESGEGREASTDQAADLARLKKEINKNLSLEVMRNMGKPALSYQTGRFANSVQLLSLTQGRSTVMANYTYLLRPYQTFENQGKYRWPMSYNPKTLIAKSIRNLAQGRIEQKLTVRRV